MDCTGCREALSELNSLKYQLSALKCPSCTNVSRRKRGGKDMPSVFSPSVMKPKHNIENILTIEKISNLLDQKLAPKSSIMIALRKELIQDVKSMIAIETSKIVNEIKDEFTKTTEFIMDEIKVLKSGESHHIYVAEHLDPETKQLFAAARKFKRDKNYAYCWVKYGKIYLRKND
ncbi:hypothetical protein ACJJTC_014218 [Scirpophaga incertulas]